MSDKVKNYADGKSLSGFDIDIFCKPNGYTTEEYYKNKLGDPGEYPYTRGIHKDMYRSKLWTIRQFSGFGRAEDTNKRWKFLLSQGQTGLSTAFDMPTLMGLDSDSPIAEGEVGVEGVAIDTIADFQKLFDGIDLEKVSVSFTINAPAIWLYSMYVLLAELRGVDTKLLRGTIQNDILKEYHAQNEWIFPPEPSMKLIVDMFEYSVKHTPKFNIISVSGYHIREAGSDAVQELAFTLADGFAYVEACLRRGLNIDEFAPRISFFFNCHMDFFEEIAKFRAARRIWARYMKEKYGAKNPNSMKLRFHTQTAGCSLTAQQPEINIVRTTIEALAAVLGGTQSLHTNSFDEALTLPSEIAARIAVRTQQVIAYESGVANVVDPLGGSYFVESMTDKIEEEAEKYFQKILRMGNGSFYDGVVEGINNGFFRREIARASYEFQSRVEKGERIIVGVNAFQDEQGGSFEYEKFKLHSSVQDEQKNFLKLIKSKRDWGSVKKSLDELSSAVRRGDNLVPYIKEAVKNFATEEEIMNTLKEIYGEYLDLKTL
ncbi:MAG: methylmalonyl-CoA mutase family protein [Candidatus Calescibacterium sp.]|nr:methylmalonyl-CoA mutase family protein [Candidatus Calescibacterium sp.]